MSVPERHDARRWARRPRLLSDLARRDADVALAGADDPGASWGRAAVPGWSRRRRLKTRASSCAGIPSVMHTTKAMPAAAASMMAAGAALGGHERRVGTRGGDGVGDGVEDGDALDVLASLPGVTPATTCVPYSRLRRPWKRPWPPVSPCTSSLVSWSTKMAMAASGRWGRARRPARPPPRQRKHGRLGDEAIGRDPGVGQDAAALLGVGPVQADDHGRPQVDPSQRLDDALGHLLTA